VLLGVFACTQRSPDASFGASEGDPIALIDTVPGGLVVAVGPGSHRDTLVTIAAGARPLDFRWVAITIATARVGELDTGLAVNLADPAAGVVFAQVYPEVCNPAESDFDACMIYERDTAGDPDLRGSLTLRVSEGHVWGGFDVYWEGLTDRFGEPIQWYGHGTSGGIDAPRDKR